MLSQASSIDTFALEEFQILLAIESPEYGVDLPFGVSIEV
jgi:hypothetical protein